MSETGLPMDNPETRAAVIDISTRLQAELDRPAARIVPEPGLHAGVPYDVYARWDAINHSILKLYARSPLHAREEMMHPKEPTPAMEFGHAAHLAILEPERFETEVLLVPESAPAERRSKADKKWWADFEHEHRGHTILKREAFDSLRVMKDAIHAHPVCRKFITAPGLNEASFAWTDPRTGLLCKAREDMLREVDGYAWALNLKSAKDASKAAFSRDIHRLQYHEAGAYYLDGMKALGQEDVRFALLVIEKERPFGCAVWELEDASLAQGRAQAREHLRKHAECVAANEWPGYSPEGADYISIPAWALKGFNDGD